MKTLSPPPNRTISSLAQRTQTPASTLRYYEEFGILTPVGRTESGYRQYDEAAVKRIELIRAAQKSGLTLADIKKVFSSDNTDCGDLRAVFTERAEQIKKQISELKKAEKALRLALKDCCLPESDGLCKELCDTQDLSCSTQ
ncbi:MAG: MerR family transcriptional regulator [Spirochaetia bacterium]|nr:MerR family transcriptional regulator [Spirochaetia bacterium]